MDIEEVAESLYEKVLYAQDLKLGIVAPQTSLMPKWHKVQELAFHSAYIHIINFR
jgi:hypothetical protein